MDQAQFWLPRPLKRFIQYWGVVLVTVPFGLLYILLLDTVSPSTAFCATFPVALFAAYFVWRWLGRVISVGQRPKPIFIYKPLAEGPSLDDPSLAVAAGTLLVFMVVIGSQSTITTFPNPQCDEVGSNNLVVSSANAAT